MNNDAMTVRTSPLLDAALSYAAQGLKVFPLKPRGKKPITEHGFQDASQLQSVIREWWTDCPNANVGIRCDGLLVGDFDGEIGKKSLALMEAKYGKLPRTRTIRTGGGTEDDPKEQGLQYIYRVATDLNIRPGAGKYGYEKFDIRANDSYIVAVPSITRLPYETIDDSPITDAPAWLIELAKTKKNAQGKPEVQPIAAIKDGSRHVDLISLIGKLRNDKLAEDLIKTMAQAANASADVPLSPVEVTKMVREYEHQTKLVAGAPECQVEVTHVKELPGMMTVSQFRNHVQSKNDGSNNDYIEDILPNSPADYALMVGRPGIGKTNEILHTLFCLASGKNWYGHTVKQCKVGYIAFEGAESKLLDRLEKLCLTYPEADIGDNFRLIRIPAFKMIGDGVKEFDRLVEGLQVVALDPLKYIVAGDYTKPADANVFLTNLKEHAVKMNVLPILVHHIRKPDKRIKIRPEDLMYEVKGAGDYVESANTVLLMELAKQTRGAGGKFGTQSAEDRILHFCKVKDSPAELFPLKLRLNRETLLFQQITDKEYDDENDD